MITEIAKAVWSKYRFVAASMGSVFIVAALLMDPPAFAYFTWGLLLGSILVYMLVEQTVKVAKKRRSHKH